MLIVALKDALMVPSTTLIPASQTTTLLPVISKEALEINEIDETKTGTVHLRQVAVGYITSDYAQIANGLEEGELVITEVQGELKDNARVRVSAIEELNF